MKSPKYSAIVLALGVLVSSAAQAQDQSNPRGEGRRGSRGGDAAQAEGRGQMMNPDARVEQLDRALQLTSDQKTKIKGIYAKSQEEMRNLMRGGRDQANREKLQELMRSSRDEVRALLTDEQKKKFDEMPQQRGTEQRGRGKDGRGSKKE